MPGTKHDTDKSTHSTNPLADDVADETIPHHTAGALAGGKACMTRTKNRTHPLADDVADETTFHHTSGGFAGGKAPMKSNLIKLIARIENSVSADVSIKDVRILAKSQDPEAIDALAGLLDDDGRVGREAVRALTRFGRIAEPTLRRCAKSANETTRGHAQELLAALGDVAICDGAELAEVTDNEVTNDNHDPVKQDFAVLADPEIVRAIAGTLFARGVPKQDIEDGVAEVQTRVLEILRVGPPPTGFVEWRALANKVAAELAIDVHRKRSARGKHEEDLCEDPDAFASEQSGMWDPVDARAMVGVYEAMLEAGELPPLAEEILAGRVQGLTDREIGEALGIDPMVVFRRRQLVRGRFGWRLAALGMGDLVPSSARQKKSGEAAIADDLPAPLRPTRHRY